MKTENSKIIFFNQVSSAIPPQACPFALGNLLMNRCDSYPELDWKIWLDLLLGNSVQEILVIDSFPLLYGVQNLFNRIRTIPLANLKLRITSVIIQNRLGLKPGGLLTWKLCQVYSQWGNYEYWLTTGQSSMRAAQTPEHPIISL